MVVMVGFNLLLFTTGAADRYFAGKIRQKHYHGLMVEVRLWGSIAFVVGSALTGKLVVIRLRGDSGAGLDGVRRLGRPTSRGAGWPAHRVRWWHKVGVFSPASVLLQGRTPPTTV